MRALWLAALMLAVPAYAGPDVPGVTTVRFRNYGVDQGMSQPSAVQIEQDHTGFIWIATQDGLDRFDGYGFRVYKHLRGDPWSLADNHITALAVDADGSLWVGTQAGGLDRYDPLLDRFEAFVADPTRNDAIAGNQVTALMLDHRNWLWIATTTGKLQWLDPSTRHIIDTPLGLQPALASVHALVEAADGSVLIGTQTGLWRCDANASHLREIHVDSAPLNVQALALSREGEIWVAAAGTGLRRLDKDGKLLARYRRAGADHALPDDDVRGMRFDGNLLWLATKTGGLVQLDPANDRLRQFRHDPAEPGSIGANRQQSVFIDHEGLLWAGSWTNGVSVHDPRTESFATVRPAPNEPRSLPVASVTAIVADPDGMLWIAVAERAGLVKFDPSIGVVKHFTPDDGAGAIPQNLVQSMTRTRDGNLWLAMTAGGLARLPPGGSSFVLYKHDANDPDSLASDDLLHVAHDRNGTLWVGTVDAGLDELCEGCKRFRHHRHDSLRPDSIGDGPVGAVFEATNGDLWVALRPGGLDRYDRAQEHFEHFRAHPQDPYSISNDAVTALMQDSRGELWIGTQGGGLNHLLPASAAPRFEAITTAEGLAADAIGAIFEDGAHALWFSTTVGISRYDPATRRVTNFGAHEGALAQGYFIDDHAVLADGRLMFGGPAGATIVDTAAVKALPAPTPILTGVLLDNQPVELRWRNEQSPLQSAPWTTGPAVLNYRQKNVSFEFSALSYGDPESIEYSYLLEGHDSGWINTGASRRVATYTNLPAGDYRLRIRARLDGDAWSEREATMPIRVMPAPWWSPLAVLGYSAALMLLVGLVGWRTRENLRRQMLAQRAVRASADRLKLALWGSGGELWDVDLRSGTVLRENRIEYLAAGSGGAHKMREYREYVHPDDLPDLERTLAAHLRGDNDFLEVTYRSPDLNGDWRWLLSRGRVVERTTGGRAVRLVGTTQDITILKRAEDELRKLNEELETRVDARTVDLRKANTDLRHTLEQLTLAQHQLLESEKMAALGGLVAGVAHEINTPLGVTVTAASHLQEEAGRIARLASQNALTPDQIAQFHSAANESSEIILRNLNRADRLIKSFKQVAVDQSSEERRTIELGAYLNEILISLGPAFKKTAHSVHVDCPEPLSLNTYPGAFYQIVSNLLMNSLNHAFAPGQAGEIIIAIRQDGDHVVLRYRDNGKGMSEDVRSRIFEPFFTTRRGQGGSGLGMHVVYNLVTQLLKGQIHVDSAPGTGTSFEIVLPINL
jgi:signal transduction histidine kinase/ligand-binding sensor domain-containing protein